MNKLLLILMACVGTLTANAQFKPGGGGNGSGFPLAADASLGGHKLTNGIAAVQIWDAGGMVFDPRNYGASVDGITVDYAAVQMAFNLAQQNFGGQVFLPSGILNLGDNAIIITNHVGVIGVGNLGGYANALAGSIISNNSVAKPVFFITNAGYVSFEKFAIANGNANPTASLILEDGSRLGNTLDMDHVRCWGGFTQLNRRCAERCTAQHCIFGNVNNTSGEAILVSVLNDFNADAGDSLFFDDIFYGSAMYGILYQSGSGLNISHCKVNGAAGNCIELPVVIAPLAGGQSLIFCDHNSTENFGSYGFLTEPNTGFTSLISLQYDHNEFLGLNTNTVNPMFLSGGVCNQAHIDHNTYEDTPTAAAIVLSGMIGVRISEETDVAGKVIATETGSTGCFTNNVAF